MTTTNELMTPEQAQHLAALSCELYMLTELSSIGVRAFLVPTPSGVPRCEIAYGFVERSGHSRRLIDL